MSIQEEWKRRVSEKALFRLEFLVPGRPEKRTVLMSEEVFQLVSGPWSNDLMGDRCARLRVTLEGILAGDPLTVCWQPYRAESHHQIGRLDRVEEEIWDIRSAEKPGLRVFFRFAATDVLVAFTCSPRSVPIPWLDRLPLLKRDSREWKRAKAECKREWAKLFPAHPPHTGVDIHAYLSNAVLD
jgi:hypothetical protein